MEGLESYDIALNEIYADKFALNSDYILKHRPPDLFQVDLCQSDNKDEENGLSNLDENGPNVNQDNLENFYNPIKPSVGRPRTSFAIPNKHEETHQQQQSRKVPSTSSRPPQSNQSKRSRDSIPFNSQTSPQEKNPKTLEHIPSMCSIVNDEDVSEIKDVAELF